MADLEQLLDGVPGRLRDFFHAKKLRVADVRKDAEITSSSMSKMLNDVTPNPGVRNYLKIALKYDLDLNEIFLGEKKVEIITKEVKKSSPKVDTRYIEIIAELSEAVNRLTEENERLKSQEWSKNGGKMAPHDAQRA